MFTQAETIVALWFLPVLLHIILPLTVLLFWLVTKPFRRDRQERAIAQDNPAEDKKVGYEPLTATEN